MRLWIAAALFLFLQDSLADRFAQTLTKAEKVQWSAPETGPACDALDALAKEPGADKLPRELLDRHLMFQSQAAVVKALFARLTKAVGADFDFPIAGGKTEKLRVVDIKRDRVTVDRGGGKQEIVISSLDAEWIIATVRSSISATDAGLVAARAGRWELAFKELAKSDCPHALVVETKKRGNDAIYARADASVKAKKWEEAIAILGELPEADARIKPARQSIYDGIVEQAKDAAKKKAKEDLKKAFDLLAKNFPGSDAVIKEITNSARWSSITDSKEFGLSMSLPFEVDNAYAWLKTAGDYDAFSLRVKTDVDKTVQTGIVWEGRDRCAWFWPQGGEFVVSHTEGADKKAVNDFHKKIEKAETHLISLFLKDGSFVLMCDGEEMYRIKTEATSLKGLGLISTGAKSWFDQIWIRRKE